MKFFDGFKITILFLLFLSTTLFALDFNKAISLHDCEVSSACRQGLLENGSWETSGYNDVRCDGGGCWNIYKQFCINYEKELKEKFDSLIAQNLWGKEESYSTNDYPKEIWDIIRTAAQMEINCFKKPPEKVLHLMKKYGSGVSLYQSCPRNDYRNCKTLDGFTKEFSPKVLQEFQTQLMQKWETVAQSQKDYIKSNSPRNLKHLGGDYSSYDEESFDRYFNMVKSLKHSKVISKRISEILAQEERFLIESEKSFQKYCFDLQSEDVAGVNQKTNECTIKSLSSKNFIAFEGKKNFRLKELEKELWHNAISQTAENPKESILEEYSFLNTYLKDYPSGTFVDSAANLYETTLAKEGMKEASQDTLLGLSEKSLLQTYLSKYPQGIFVEEINSFLEKMLYSYAKSQVNKNPLQAINSDSYLAIYLKKHPNGLFADSVAYLYESTLAMEGLKEAKRDTLRGLSEKSLLHKYLFEYPQGAFAEKAKTFLEKLLYNYAVSQIKKDPQFATSEESYSSLYLEKYPTGKYKDSLTSILEATHWNLFAPQCNKDQVKSSCQPLIDFTTKFSSSIYLDSARKLIDEPIWSAIAIHECFYYEDSNCSEIEMYVEIVPNGKHIKDAKQFLSKASKNSEKRDLEQQKKAEREEQALAWLNEYEKTVEGCTFITKKDTYDYEWGSDKTFPEKNGTLECVEKVDLALDSLDKTNYKCIEKDEILVKNGKISGGNGTCISAHQEVLIRKKFLSNGKFKSTLNFPEKITLTINENGEYSIISKKTKLADLDFNTIMKILSSVSLAKDLSYLYDVDDVVFEWNKTGQIKNIKIKEFDTNEKVLSKLNIPLNTRGKLNGISEIYTASTGNFKIEWNNGSFKRISGGKKLKQALCPDYVCGNLTRELRVSGIVHHFIPTIESSRETANYEGLENGFMLYYVAYLLGISINQGLDIWNSL